MRVAIALVLGLAATCLALADEPVQVPQMPPALEELPVPRPLPQGPVQAPPMQPAPKPAAPVRPRPKPPAPPPRPLPDSFPRPQNPLTEVLQQLGKEREALAAAHNDAVRDFDDGLTISTTANAMLRLRVKQLLAKLSQQRAAARETPSPGSASSGSPPPAPSPKHDKSPLPPLLAPVQPRSSPGVAKMVDPLAVAHALFRAGSSEAALQAFRLINLKGMRAEQRAPIQYLMASCLRKLGKLDDALALYREVANSKGDESVAACAQWQIANLRWQRETLDKLAEIKQRRLALEK